MPVTGLAWTRSIWAYIKGCGAYSYWLPQLLHPYSHCHRCYSCPNTARTSRAVVFQNRLSMLCIRPGLAVGMINILDFCSAILQLSFAQPLRLFLNGEAAWYAVIKAPIDNNLMVLAPTRGQFLDVQQWIVFMRALLAQEYPKMHGGRKSASWSERQTTKIRLGM